MEKMNWEAENEEKLKEKQLNLIASLAEEEIGIWGTEMNLDGNNHQNTTFITERENHFIKHLRNK